MPLWRRFVVDSEFENKFYTSHIEPGYFQQAFPGNYHTLEPDDPLQKKGIDVIARHSSGRETSFELKTVRHPHKWDEARKLYVPKRRPYTAIAAEVKSEMPQKPGEGLGRKEKDGWMKYAEALWLLYSYSNLSQTALRCFLIDFRALRSWFWPYIEENPGVFKLWKDPDPERSGAQCYVVPWSFIRDANIVMKEKYLGCESFDEWMALDEEAWLTYEKTGRAPR